GQSLHEINDLLRNRAVRCELLCCVVQFGLLRQFSEPQKVASLFKGRIGCQFMDVVSPIGKNPFVSVNETNSGFTGYDVFYSRFHFLPLPPSGLLFGLRLPGLALRAAAPRCLTVGPTGQATVGTYLLDGYLAGPPRPMCNSRALHESAILINLLKEFLA